MAPLDLDAQGLEIAVVRDDLIGGLQPSRARGLGRENGPGFLERRAVPRLQAPDLERLVAVHDEHAVGERRVALLDEQGQDEDLVRSTRRRRALLHRLEDRGVRQRLEVCPRLRVRKYDAAQGSPIEAPVGADECLAESLGDMA